MTWSRRATSFRAISWGDLEPPVCQLLLGRILTPAPRDEMAAKRNAAAGRRDRKAERRDQVADEQDVAAQGRVVRSDERGRAAGTRDLTADRRDRVAEARANDTVEAGRDRG
jgi:hypothetical protein